jgi:hypothetical protein
MPTSCWGRYRKVAVLRVVPGYVPKVINDRPHGVLEIPWYEGQLNEGTTKRSAYYRALRQAEKYAQDQNGECAGLGVDRIITST